MDYLDTPEKFNRRMTHNPMGRFGEAVEQAKAVVFRESASPAALLGWFQADLQSLRTTHHTSTVPTLSSMVVFTDATL
jgi:hypothetical protein